MREHYNISLPLAVLLSVVGTWLCGRNFKLDLQDLARHNRIEHDGSLAHADTIPGGQYAPIAVDKERLQNLLEGSKGSDTLTFQDLVMVRAARDAKLSRPLSSFHGAIARGEVALAVQTLGDEEGNIPKQFIREWFGEERLPRGWCKPAIATGIRSTTRIANWIGELVQRILGI